MIDFHFIPDARDGKEELYLFEERWAICEMDGIPREQAMRTAERQLDLLLREVHEKMRRYES